jgi:hypothetical protein
MINKLNNSKFNAITCFKVQDKNCFKIKEKEDRYVKKATQIYNYTGEKPLTLICIYVKNLEENIAHRIKDYQGKIVGLDALAYLTCAASLVDHETRIRLFELAITLFKWHIMAHNGSN